ncbi:MAG: beta-N-acetylhexosaminidase, partial [Flavitalea sp.]
MKKNTLVLVLCFIVTMVNAQSKISIIPEPVSVKSSDGTFTLPPNITLDAPSGKEVEQTISFLTDRLTKPTGYKVTWNSSNPTIKLALNSSADATLGKEGYKLSVTPSNIVITANQPAGLYYGAQSLVQLFPPEIEGSSKTDMVKWEAPTVEVIDYPRFGWRGMMFDVSRHFFTKNEVFHFIDDMVRYKYNLLHLHLTDDEGWRIEIKSFPKLTSVGAWNVKKVGYFGDMKPPAANEPHDYGGFYTQEDIKEIVKYASDRFVNILPEIDVPGHSLATIAAYPELSCTPGADKYVVRSGEKIMDWHSKGFTALVDNTLCPANENVYAFLDKVVTEVAALFPFEYMHLGGDECAKNFWEKSDAVKALMKKENLKDMHAVQSYFTQRLSKIVESKGKKFMGWDEILEGEMAKNAAVMSWRGMKGGIDAAKMGHEVVMSPTTFAYIDYMQGDAAIESRVYASLRLNKSYEFDPLPPGVDPKFIKGGQANLWTEQIYNYRYLQYMVWPRGFAIAESVWSPK